MNLSAEPDADGQGESFKFRVNGEDVFIKGANWIPADSFPARLKHDIKPSHTVEDDRRVEQLVKMAADAGMNMLRVWGGGLYESEHFYDLCDRHGILVWQDFPHACGYYPDREEYRTAAHLEATAALRRIRVHPSLALLCGNNENQTMFDGNWSGIRPPRLIGDKLYHEVYPSVIADECPQAGYWPSSPYGGADSNSPDFGDRHNWDVWHGIGDWTNYADRQFAVLLGVRLCRVLRLGGLELLPCAGGQGCLHARRALARQDAQGVRHLSAGPGRSPLPAHRIAGRFGLFHAD